MAGAVVLLIVGAVVGVATPAVGVWLRVMRGRRNRSTLTARNRSDPGAYVDSFMETAFAGPGGTIDLTNEPMTIIPLTQPAERNEEVVLNEISDLKKLVSGVAEKIAVDATPGPPIEAGTGPDAHWDQERGLAEGAAITIPFTQNAEQDGEVVLDEVLGLKPHTSDLADTTEVDIISMPSLEIAMGDDGERGSERYEAEIAPEPTVTSEPVLSGLSTVGDDARRPPPGDAALSDTPSVLGAELADDAPRADEHEVHSSSEIAQSHECADQDESAVAEVRSSERAEGEDLAAATDAEAEKAPHVIERAANRGDSEEPVADQVMSGSDVLTDCVPEDAAADVGNGEEPVRPRLRPSKPAQHRDRRGQRRVLPPQPATSAEQPSRGRGALRAPAEAKLRLMLHPIRRAAALSAVLARPDGYPDHVTLLLGGHVKISAYSEDRYDDLDLEWTADLLSREVRLDCNEGYQWLRSGRRIHIFSEVADEPGLISVGSASLTSPSTIVCPSEDVAAVCIVAKACGSSDLISHDHWNGIPDGWTILSGYHPTRAATAGLATWLTAVDPGVGSEIRFGEGLRVRSASFAEGSPPKIEIIPFPSGAAVTIDGQPAVLHEDGAWRADGWDRPGDHLVDVVPGPSAAYRIVQDPWSEQGWETWDAHPERFGALSHAPWAKAQICGGSVSGPGGEYVVAAEAMASVICLGLRRGAVALRGRPDAPVAVGLLKEPPAFLISASGPRRSQGRVAWLSPTAPSSTIRAIDPNWIAVVRSAASRRLPLDGGGFSAEAAWRRARDRARRHRKPRI